MFLSSSVAKEQFGINLGVTFDAAPLVIPVDRNLGYESNGGLLFLVVATALGCGSLD